MASAITPEVVPLEEYLRGSYKPDRDFVKGELQERNLGEIEHSEMQLAILLWFVRHAEQWRIAPLPEMRVQISDDHYRVADVAVISADAPREKALVTPPLIVVEILSAEDRVQRYRERLDDYLAMGIPHIWVVDPIEKIGFDCSHGDWVRRNRLEAGSGIYLSIPELGVTR